MSKRPEADIIVADWRGLMKALGVDSVLAAEDALEQYCDFSDVIVEQDSDDEILIVSVGGSSFGLPYPFPLSTLFCYVDEADWENRARDEWEQLEQDIEATERFRTEVTCWPAGDDYRGLRETPPYAYKRAAPGSWTVARWLKVRVRPVYPEYRVVALRPDLSEVHGRTQLKSLRQEWALMD